MRIALVVNLAAYSMVVSQPLFYIFALTSAQKALSAGAYVELRQRVNAVMNRNVPIAYVGTLLLLLLVIALAWRSEERLVLGGTAVALACLVVDLVLMLRENVPINSVMDGWSPENCPADWADHRAKWFAVFRYRQVVLLFGFLNLLIAAVFRSSP